MASVTSDKCLERFVPKLGCILDLSDFVDDINGKMSKEETRRNRVILMVYYHLNANIEDVECVYEISSAILKIFCTIVYKYMQFFANG